MHVYRIMRLSLIKGSLSFVNKPMNSDERVRRILELLLAGISVDVIAWKLGLDYKLFWGLLATVITLAGYAIYISQMYPSGDDEPVKPEPYSWALFGFFTASGAVAQIAQGGRAGSWCLVVTAAACFLIAGWSACKWR